MAYPNTAEVKTYLGISAGDDDALIAALLVDAQAIIENYTGRTILTTVTESRYYDAIADVDGDTLYLRRDDDLYAVDTITNGDGVEVTSDQYVLIPTSGPPYYAIKIKSTASIAWTYSTYHENAIQVDADWTYGENLPDVEHALVRLTAWLYKQKDSSMPIDVPKVSASGVLIMPMDLPKDVKGILDRYRRRF